MLRYVYCVISEREQKELTTAYKEQIEQIIKEAAFYRFDKIKIADSKLQTYTFFMNRIHDTYAAGFLHFDSICTSFAQFLKILMDHGLIRAKPVAKIVEDDEFYWEYGD
jgi:hypothetical protein